MKVLQIVKTSEGANWAFEQAKKLKENGIEIVTVLPDKKGKIANKYIEDNIKIIEEDCSLPMKNPWRIFSKRKKIQAMIEKEKPDIIHMHFVTNVIMCRIALRKDKTPRIFQVPGPLHLEHMLFRKLEILSSNENDYWLPSCIKSKEIYLKEKINPDKIFLAYYGGYGGKTVEQYEENTNILHQQFSIGKNDILVGMISYFYKPKKYLFQKRGIKGHEDFIDAIEIIRRENKRVKGIIIGGAWGNSQKYERKVKQYANRVCKNGIIFTGFRNDIKKIYKELDIVVHPSHSENLGGAAESLAAGVPTIATNVGGFPDVVVEGETGYLCDKKSPESIVEKVNMILADKEKSKVMGLKGKEKIRELLDINNTSNIVYKIYVEILKRRKK